MLHPDTAISQVVVHLNEFRNNLPVVEEGTGKLLGIVSYWDIVGRLLGVAVFFVMTTLLGGGGDGHGIEPALPDPSGSPA